MESGLLTFPSRAGTITCASAFGSAKVQLAHEPVPHLHVALSSLHLLLPSPCPLAVTFGRALRELSGCTSFGITSFALRQNFSAM